ncbi:ankyrin [Imleria badia]|nr:ankyrin [Imleria badia]
MRSILSQLLCQRRGNGVDPGRWFDELMKAKERGGGTRKNAKQLAEFASHIADLVAQKPVVIVDALDECKDVPELLQAIMVMKGRVRLFMTSRPLHAIMGNLSGLPFVSMDDTADELSADIELHVTRELDARQRLRDLAMDFKTEIRSVLCKKADGMFRWVQCSINTLNQCVTRKEVRNALNNLPEGLDETYERILVAININVREGQLAQRALVWLVASLRPLRLDELMEGLSINLHTRTMDLDSQPMHNGALLDACGSLVTYIERTGVIILSHFSVKEYLMGEFTGSKLSCYHINWKLAHLHLARSCMCYISICLNHPQSSGRSNDTLPHVPGVSPKCGVMSQPLRDYVLDHAFDHFSHLGPHLESILYEIEVLEKDTQTHSRIWDNMCLSSDQDRLYPRTGWPTSKHNFTLYILVAFAPNSILRKFLRGTGFRPKEGTNPLVYAAYFNKHEQACTLLSRGAKLNRRGWGIVRSCWALPIEVAFQSHHYDLVALFVAEGSPVPLHILSHILHSREHYFWNIPSSIVKVLLQTDDFAEAATSPLKELFLRPSVLFDCLLNNSINEQDLVVIIRRVIQVGYDPFGATSRPDSLIRIATQRGHVAAVQYLLSLGLSLPSDVLVTVNFERMQNRARMVHFLVNNGANVLAYNKCGDSVLHISLATFEEPESLEIARLLVAHGCNPLQLPNSSGETPLHIATKQGHISVVSHLLSLGVPLPSNLLGTLGLRWLKGHKRLFCYLIEIGANVIARTSAGDSVLHIALEAFDEHDALETAKLLVAYGCNPLRADHRGRSPLRLAVERGYVSVVSHLISLGATLTSDLFMLSMWRRMPDAARMIHSLVENGLGALACNRSGDCLLHIAMHVFDEDKVLRPTKLLVTHGCSLLQANSCGETPLHIAVERGYVHVVHYYLSLGTLLPSDLLATSNLWRMKNPTRMIRLLIENGANAHEDDSFLHKVLDFFDDSEHNILETAKLLVTGGCDPLRVNSYGETPLHIAVRRGHVSVVHYFLSLGAPLPSDLLATWSSWRMNRTRMIHFLVESGANTPPHTIDEEYPLLHVVLEDSDKHNVLETVKLLVTHGCDPFQVNSYGETPLHLAVGQGHLSVVHYLLSLGAPFPSGPFATWRSWRKEDCATMIRCLIENGANTPAYTINQDPLLHIVLEHVDDHDVLETVKLLVTHGCDTLQVNSHGETPLQIALRQGHVSVVHYFLSLDVPLPSNLFAKWSSRMMENRTTMIRYFVENKADALTDYICGDLFLHTVDEYDTFKIVKLLVAHGWDPLRANYSGQTPLQIAVARGHSSVASYLLSLGATLSSDQLILPMCKAGMIHFLAENGFGVLSQTESGDSLLHVALETFFKHEVLAATKLLLAHGCDPLRPNSRGETPIRIAIERGCIFLVDYLLSLGVPLPCDALFIALYSPRLWLGRSEMVYFLVDQGTNLLTRQSNGDTLLHAVITAFDHGGPEILEVLTFLLNRGCDLAISETHGLTSLHSVVRRGDVVLMKLLLALNVPLPPDILFTAIESHCMSNSQLMDVVQVLVTSGCDTLSRRGNKAGYTPLHAAVVKGYVAVVDYLLGMMDSPPSEDLLSAAALAPSDVRSQMISTLNCRRARSESPDRPDLPPPKRIRYS